MRIHRQHVDKDIEEFEVQKISIKLANPFKTKAIAQAKIKTDKLDASLGTTVQNGFCGRMLCGIYKKSCENRDLLRHRIRLVEDQTKVKARVISILDKYDLTNTEKHVWRTWYCMAQKTTIR